MNFNRTFVLAIKSSIRISIAFIITFSALHKGISQKHLGRTLTKAAKSTYYSGILNYSLQFTILSPTGDTFTEIHNVFLKNTKKEFLYVSSKRDSLDEMYFNKLLLRSNSRSKAFKISYFDEEEIRFYFDQIYQPFTDKEFKNNFLGDSINYIKLYEDEIKLIVKVEYLNPGELDEFYYTFTISKPTNLILEYSSNALIAGIPLYENWKILKVGYPSVKSDSSMVYQTKYYNIINTYEPYCEELSQAKNEHNDSSEKLSLEELQGVLPTLNLISTQDDTIQLINTKSEFTLVDFWFRSCFACIKSLPVLKELRNKYSEEFLNIVSINNVDKSIDMIDKFAEDNKIPYKIFVKSLELGNRFDNVVSYPTFFIYDRNFNILKTIDGYSDKLYEDIDSVFRN